MTRTLLSNLIAVISFLLSGCTFAKYAKVRVHVVDEQTQAGIPKARVRTFYIKPMLDMTYQREDHEKTDRDGFATLSVATNWSQRMILGWTHGIIPMISVEAAGYRQRDIGVPHDAYDRAAPVLIQMTRTNGPNQITGANSRPASTFDARRQFVCTSCTPPFLSAAVAQFCR